MELTRTIFVLNLACQVFCFLSEKQIIDKVQLLSETQFNFIHVETLNKILVKKLIPTYQIYLHKSNHSQYHNTIIFNKTEVNDLEQYILSKKILIVEMKSHNQEK